ncbi:cell wall metabolism sensor histidine kinase WalK [Arthrobacter sp. CAN_C5]|uniref:sensor histidine kinase n=1 Tax=Arthrobacter sp. CAN_C5 TaxID=2760706 RepID=UPI001FD88C6B|nr:HAMP domain-containing sensor histidine kinase [Arthrobacter sp. CAN_C5]MBP2218170.1 two-component system OmpR family sensor kinase [Arthrobacter sp. CAN_C5]
MTLLMVVTVAITGIVTVSLLRTNLIEQMDSDILVNAPNVAQNILPDGSADGSLLRFYGELRNEDGQLLRATVSQGSTDVPDIPVLNVEQVQARGQDGFTVPGSVSGSPGWRVVLFALRNEQGSVAVASSLSTVNRSLEEVGQIIFGVGLGATMVASGIAFIAVTRQFRPLGRVERTAAAIAAGDLSRRVEVERPATEVGRLSRSLNAMLAHIEAAFSARTESERKMRRFVADASHELRTPLVTIRGFSELYRHGALQNDDDVGAAMGRIESEAKRMGELVEDLLTLARIDEQRPLKSEPLDLVILGNDAALDARAIAPDRQITVIGLDGGPAQPAPTVGDEARLRQVVANLMTNALRYTPDGTPIEIAVGVAPVIHGRMDSVIEVRDHGPGISEEDAARVFERFYRADSSRYRETGGTGLGLAIVAALVAQHDGSVRLEETVGGGATLSIRLPYTAVEADSSSTMS